MADQPGATPCPPETEPPVGAPRRRAGGRLDVLHVITTTTPRGAERFAVELDQALAARGWASATVALTAGPGRELAEVPTLGPERLHPTTIRALARMARRSQVVVAHGSTTLPATWLATRANRVPFVYRNIGDPRFWQTSTTRRLRSGLLLRSARRVVALTPGTATALTELHRIASSRIDVVPQATSASAFPLRTAATRRAARDALGLAQDQRLALVVGALSPEKDVPTAVRAVGLLPDHWHLAVAGDGSEEARVRDEARSLGSRAHLLGRVADPAPVMAAADVLVLSSRTEGLPGVLIEAALTGVPAVATDVGYVADIVDHGRTGLLVAPGDPAALAAAVAEHEDRLDAMGRAAHRHVAERYAFDRVVTRWEDVLVDLGAVPERRSQRA